MNFQFIAATSCARRVQLVAVPDGKYASGLVAVHDGKYASGLVAVHDGKYAPGLLAASLATCSSGVDRGLRPPPKGLPACTYAHGMLPRGELFGVDCRSQGAGAT